MNHRALPSHKPPNTKSSQRVPAQSSKSTNSPKGRKAARGDGSPPAGNGFKWRPD